MKRPLSGLLLLTAFCLVPFLAKPFHIDDAYYVRVAENILSRPAAPYDFLYNCNGTAAPAWLTDIHPPLHPYLLALAAWLFGEGEVPAHAAYLFFPLACIALMHSLARRFCATPATAVLAVAASPAFLVGATGVMNDLPLLFFWLLSARLALLSADREAPALLWLSGAAAAAAALTTYLGLALVPLLCLYHALRRRSASGHLAAFLLPPAAVLLWGLYSLPHAGFFHPAAALFYSGGGARPLLERALVTAAFLGGSLLWPLFFLPAAALLRGKPAALLLLAGAGLAAAAFFKPEFSAFWLLLALAGTASIIFALHGALEELSADSLFLALWLLGIVFYAGFVNISVNVRGLLPAAFPAAVLAARWAQKRSPAALLAFRCALLPALAASFWLASADQGLARTQRGFAEAAARPLAAEGRHVYFIGHWGFQHYMEKSGASAYDYRRTELRPGDILLVSTNNTGTFALPAGLRARLKTLKKITIPNPYGVATMDAAGRTAGFYSSIFATVPFTLGRDVSYDTFLIQTLKAVEKK